MTQKIAIIDYGMGNLHSAAKAVEKVSSADTIVQVTQDKTVIKQADKVIFPGVGAIRDCMAGIEQYDLKDAILDACNTKPVLGICIAMQALCKHSEENGGVDCLNIFPNKIKFFDLESKDLKVPHMGWSQVQQMTKHALWKNIDNNAYFYFVHSYHAPFCAENELINKTENKVKNMEKYTIGTCDYEVPFSAAIAKENVAAVQFHPEKSANNGLKLLQNFCDWNI